MKKNVMMRLASFLLVAVLISTSAISGTYAKYVTEATGTDTARVAKWGVTITANGGTFGTAYNRVQDGNDEVVGSVELTTDTVNNGGADSMNLVAPGTKGEMVNMALSGTPEVMVKVTYTGKFDVSDNWLDGNGKFYCPLVVKVNDTTIYGVACDTAAAFENAVNAAITGYSKTYVAGTDLSTVGDDALDISWEWPYSTSPENDVRDTDLGNQASVNNYATVTLEVVTTVTQVD